MDTIVAALALQEQGVDHRSLTLYRLAFGQPRQQELLENLLCREFDDAEIAAIKHKLMIDLAPLNYLDAAPDLIEVSDDHSVILVTKPSLAFERDLNVRFEINSLQSRDDRLPGAEK